MSNTFAGIARLRKQKMPKKYSWFSNSACVGNKNYIGPLKRKKINHVHIMSHMEYQFYNFNRPCVLYTEDPLQFLNKPCVLHTEDTFYARKIQGG